MEEKNKMQEGNIRKLKTSAIMIICLAFLGLIASTYFLADNLINFNTNFILYILLVILNMVTILQGVIILSQKNE